MPESRFEEFADRLNWRANTARAVPPAGGALILTSYVLPAAMNTSLCTRGTPGNGFPSSAMRENPPVFPLPVVDPTIEGTCMREPALTIRTNTLPVRVAGETGN